ncbi:MAG TPA: hypothetical protein VID27_10930 [Blastocatellia bacterium]|jgi:hypothetical protein
MTVREKAWAAGMFESRGSIIINKAGDRSFHLRCMLVGIDRRIPEFFQSRWPGSLTSISRPKGSQAQWKWVVTGSGAAVFLKSISPFFETAQAKAKTAIALEFQNLKEIGSDYDSQFSSYKRLGALNDFKRKGSRFS